jgi:hypothetical protein
MLIEHHLSRGENGQAIFRETDQDTMVAVLTDPKTRTYANESLSRADARAAFAVLRKAGWKAESNAPHRFNVILAITRYAAARGWERLTFAGLAP